MLRDIEHAHELRKADRLAGNEQHALHRPEKLLFRDPVPGGFRRVFRRFFRRVLRDRRGYRAVFAVFRDAFFVHRQSASSI